MMHYCNYINVKFKLKGNYFVLRILCYMSYKHALKRELEKNKREKD